MRKLIRLQFLQFRRSSSKMEVFGRVYILVCFWMFELIGILELKSELGELPSLHGAARSLILAGICVFVGIVDVIYKLIFKHDATVMDSFLKTRPVPESFWEKYLVISQFWHPDNLMMPLLMLPICFALFHIGCGLIAFMILYLISVAGGIFLMEARRGSNYDEETTAKRMRARSIWLNNYVFSIQSLSFLRSRRLKTSMFIILLMAIIFIISQSEGNVDYVIFITLFFCSPMGIGQYGFGIEANCFGSLWTKPIRISIILSDKYYFLGMMTIILSVLLSLVCLLCRIPLFPVWGSCIYIAGMVNLVILSDAFNTVRYELFGKSFFNYQGSASTFRSSVFLIVFLSMALGTILILLFDRWTQFVMLCGLGFIGFALHRPIFRWEEKKFLNNRYKYMEKYSK